jgi:TP901 family phage tail tape measure protein
MASASGIRLGKVFVEIGADPSKLFGALNRLNKRIGSIGSSMTNFGGKMTALGAGLAAPLGLAARQFATFDDAIRATAAVTGSLGPQGAASLAMLNDKARELGATTSFTAVQVANLMTELGRAGFNPQEINDMTGAVLDLARATGTDATLSAGIMAATLRQFALGAGDAARVADVLTAAANSTFNTVEGLGESLKYAGPVAKSLGMELEDTVAVLGVLGNVGIQGSEAGTALRRLGVITAGAGKELQDLFGISNTDAAGNLKPMIAILDEINSVTASMGAAERTEKMAKAFGLLGITSANVLSQAAGGVTDLAEKLRTAEGTAASTAKAMDAGLGGAMRIAMSAIEGTALAIGDALAPGLQKAIEFISNFATGMTAFVKQNGDAVVSFAQTSAGILGFGAALIAAGKALTLLSSVMAIVLSPLGLVAAGVALIAVKSGFAEEAIDGLQQTAEGVGSKISEALGSGDFEKAWIYAIAAVEEALLRMRAAFERAIQRPINLAAVRLAETGATTGLRQRLFEMTKGANAGGFKDARRSFEALQTASTADEFNSARAAAMKSAQEARGRGQEDPASALEEMIELVKQRLTQVGVLGDNALERGIQEITARAEGKIADLDTKRAAAAAAEAARPQMGEMGPAMAGGAAALPPPGGGLSAPPWLQAMIDDEKARRDAEERARKIEEENRAAVASQSEAVGTFSSVGIGGMGFGGNLQERQLKALEEIADNTKDMDGGSIDN